MNARLSPGQMVRVRTRTYLVENVTEDATGGPEVVQLACVDDDAQGDRLDVVWSLELNTAVLDSDAFKSIGRKGFDDPQRFGSYLHAVRWNCVTATDPSLFQSPFRAGIRLDAYQLEPLQKALKLPRVNLFIADDVGLGKTIEAGLIASELLLRRRVQDVVVACPPSMLIQWREELESRFGLTFEILDRAYVDQVRRERGYSVNPWTTFPRFLVSHRLLIDETYAAPLRDWLDNIRPGSLLILDEAHHAAPSSGAKYAIDSKITKAIRDLAPRFEHRLFLSATPHNGHSNSFSALLELLDPHRFTRGVPPTKANLDATMVRRLKEDIRAVAGGFPKREVVQVDLKDLPADAPELVLSRLLDEYRQVRQRRVASATKRKQAEAMLLISGLQQRLLSSIEAFARTLRVHRRTMERLWAKEASEAETRNVDVDLLVGSPDADHDLATLDEEDLAALADEAMGRATVATAGDLASADVAGERRLLDEMQRVADGSRSVPDARVRVLISWLQTNACPGVHLPGQSSRVPNAAWADRRILIFTEYDDTKRYLVEMLRAAIAGTDRAEQRIMVFHGPTPPADREAIKRAFNAPPDEHPVRILVATDAAREGLNLQAYCYDLFHFDLPWNPSRIEQRNGRIDRKLQRSKNVYCHYFYYCDRAEDQVLQALVRKTGRIREQLGSLSQVLETRLAEMIRGGIRHGEAAGLKERIDALEGGDRTDVVVDELEQTRERQEALVQQIDRLRNGIQRAHRWIGLDNDRLRGALSCALEMQGAQPLTPADTPARQPQRYVLPDLEQRHGADPTWRGTLETLRKRSDAAPDFAARTTAPLRPVVFDAPEAIDESVVQLHLEHRVVKRLLGRFLAQGFVHHDLSRAVLASSGDAIPRVVLFGRMSLYGPSAVRLHDEVLTVTARWIEPSTRKGPLAPFARAAEGRTVELLDQSLGQAQGRAVAAPIVERLRESMPRDLDELLPHLEQRANAARSDADEKLSARGRIEAAEMRRILEDQRKRVAAQLGRQEQLDLFEEERRQLQADRKAWERFIANVDGDLAREPQRIEAFYRVSSWRVEPIGLAYLWPATG